MNGGGCAGHAPAPSNNSNNIRSAGTEETTKKKPAELEETTNVVAGPSSRKKRAYEHNKHELDVSMLKLFKCNYWEDPAYAGKIEFFGLALARSAAFDNLMERLDREFQAWKAGRPVDDDEDQ